MLPPEEKQLKVTLVGRCGQPVLLQRACRLSSAGCPIKLHALTRSHQGSLLVIHLLMQTGTVVDFGDRLTPNELDDEEETDVNDDDMKGSGKGKENDDDELSGDLFQTDLP